MPYHVGLDLTEHEVKELKQEALARDLSVKDLIAKLVREALDQKQAKKAK